MRISFVEIANFRKLLSVRIDLASATTLLVGANNSGKTSAMIALRQFLLHRESFRINDFTLCHWETITAIGSLWEKAKPEDEPSDEIENWLKVCPTLDLWLDVADGEFHHVSGLLPFLDWAGGRLGVRLRFEPKNIPELRKDFLVSSREAAAVRDAMPTDKDGQKQKPPKLWPEGLLPFLERRLQKHFEIRAYLLDPEKLKTPSKGIASLQTLPDGYLPLDGDPLERLIKISEISAQRGFGYAADSSTTERGANKPDRRLSDQLKRYYSKHLDPQDKPAPEDLKALQAIDTAEEAFDERLQNSFIKAFSEVQGIGYPGVTDPRLKVTTKLRPIDALTHDAAVTYEVDMVSGGATIPMLRLPEDSNGLGYQNLISMIFALMSFRDAWMRVGKAKLGAPGNTEDIVIEPMHLVLVEEPEAHLHAQVQQVFIKKAYDILTDSKELKGDSPFKTQVVVSSHSSHVAHETPYDCLRYFRRLPAGMASTVPVSAVLDMAAVFGEGDDTKRFVTRYLKATHCDLFFADAVILLEGPAERMLVPHFIRLRFPFLNQCYISLLEIGGSHAHKLRPLLEHLGILALVITDIDAGKDSVAVPTRRGESQTTNNPTLREWLPKLSPVDELLAATESMKISEQDALAAVRVAYQTGISVASTTGGDVDGASAQLQEEALPSTFEDSLAFTNVAFFSALSGSGLVAKFRDALSGQGNVAAKSGDLFDALRSGKKAEFALDVIDAQQFETLSVPAYISDGLAWLESRLKKKQVEILGTEARLVPQEIPTP
jgi:predicted ATP-dependent endonuclease of OLD family